MTKAHTHTREMQKTHTERAWQWKFFVRMLLVIPALLALGGVARAQSPSYLQEYGVPAYSAADPVEYGFLEQANGHLHLEFPMGTPIPQRGNPMGLQFR